MREGWLDRKERIPPKTTVSGILMLGSNPRRRKRASGNTEVAPSGAGGLQSRNDRESRVRITRFQSARLPSRRRHLTAPAKPQWKGRSRQKSTIYAGGISAQIFEIRVLPHFELGDNVERK